MGKITIAIDGFSSTGKSTLAKDLAALLGFVYIDSGAMYRAVALYAKEEGLINGKVNEKALFSHLDDLEISFEYNEDRKASDLILNGRNVENSIRTMEISQIVSRVSALGPVREKLVALQKKSGRNRGVVMDGRDIGTVVFPDAELKIFMQADGEIRAQRRFNELQRKNMPAKIEVVRENLQERDRIDMNRAISPLKKADDARILDNSSLNHEEQLQIALRWAKEAMNS